MTLLTQPWPWYVAGPLLGLMVPLVYLYAGRKWGISATFRDVCAATVPGRIEYFRYSWRENGGWRLTMALGLMAGGFVGGITGSGHVAISDATLADLSRLGITEFGGLVPIELFSWETLTTVPGAILILGGGFLVGLGARYANGCTSGHAISGLSALRLTSLVAVIGFFIGGIVATHLLLPAILGGMS